jgi:hypothetical protein
MNYLKRFFLATIFLAVIGAAINYFINPFSIFNVPIISKINSKKSPGSPRFFKPLQASARQPETVILGSSRAQVGIDPDDSPNTYNCSISGVVVREMRANGEHLLADTKLQRLIIRLDFFLFNDARREQGSSSTAIIGKNTLGRALPETLFSFEALNRSQKILRSSYAQKNVYHQSNGFFLRKLKNLSAEEAITSTVKSFLTPGSFYLPFTHTDRSLKNLDMLVVQAKEKGVLVGMFILPTHVALMETKYIIGLCENYEDWAHQLTDIAEKHSFKLWDFGGYTKITTVPLATSQRNFFNGGHYRPYIGKLILITLDRMEKSHSFGHRLSKQNIKSRLINHRKKTAI